jgi:LacI family transcriptional regulator
MDVPRNTKARIIDIALQAGVSTATVDRVLNDRPGVRQKTARRVRDAIALFEKTPARPTIIPSIPADITVDVIIAGQAGFANDMLARELRRQAVESGLTLRIDYPKRMDPLALAQSLEQCLARGTSGVIVQPLDHPIVREAIQTICDKDIPMISILTSLPGSKTRGYVGLDNRAAGRTAGLLMSRMCKSPGEVAIFWGGQLYRGHEERESGFRSVVRGEFPDLTLLGLSQGQDDPDTNYRMAKELLQLHPNLCGIYSIGGGNRGIEKALIESGRAESIIYVAFNLTPLTRQALLSGVIDAVVHQDMARAAKIAIGALIDGFLGKPVEFPRVPIEVVMRENIPEQQS